MLSCKPFYLCQGGYIFVGACLFICLLAGLHQN